MAILKSDSSLYPRYKGAEKLVPSEFKRFKKLIVALIASGHINTKPVKVKSFKYAYVHITKIGIDHALNLRGSVAKCKSLTVIRQLLATASVTDIRHDKENSKLSVLKLENMISIDGKIWKVLMYVKQGVNGRYYYHHDLAKYNRVG